MSNPTVPDAILEGIRAGRRFLVTSHLNPDGDAVGTAVGLARLLRRLGKSATVWFRDPPPDLYAPVVGSERLHVGAELPSGFPEDFDSVVVLECPSLDRCGLEAHLQGMPLINIDHHLGNELYGGANWVDSAAPAVGELVFRLARALRVEIDAAAATALYVAIETDTGGFRFSNATSRAFEAAGALVDDGARPEEVSKWLYESRPLSTVKLLSRVLPSLTLGAEGRVATLTVTLGDYEAAGATRTDTEGLIDYPRAISGVDAVALARELEDGGVKVSLRSRGDLDVEALARVHGGGGHRNAAGFTVPDEDDASAVAARTRRELEELVEGA